MGPDLTPDVTLPGNRTACPQCGASARADADFCGQCYADFRPPVPQPSAPVAPAPTASYGIPASDPLALPLPEVTVPTQVAPEEPAVAAPLAAAVPGRHGVPERQITWPCVRCSAKNDIDATVCQTCGTSFLQTVSEETRVTLKLPVVGDIHRFSRGQRAGLAFGALAVVLIPLALITLLTTGRPNSDSSKSTGTTTTTTTVNQGSGSNE